MKGIPMSPHEKQKRIEKVLNYKEFKIVVYVSDIKVKSGEHDCEIEISKTVKLDKRILRYDKNLLEETIENIKAEIDKGKIK